MFSPDTETRRLLVLEHQEQLRRDAQPAIRTDPDPAPVESSASRHQTFHLPRLRIRLHPARGAR